MFFGKTFCQKRIANRARKGYVNDSVRMDVSDLSISELEFFSAEAVGMN